MMAGLAVRDVTVELSGTPIISQVSLELEPGRVTAIIGPNGAGKSTLLKVAAGQLAPTRGSVLLDGVPISRMSAAHAARQRAVMPQDCAVAFPFTVAEVVAMGRTAWRGHGMDCDAIVETAIELTDMTRLAQRDVTTLSGGERQRAALARVIAQALPITSKRVLLLDEPTAAMDIAYAETTLRLLRELAQQRCAVGVVLHDIDAAASYADQIVLMRNGRIEAADTAENVCTADRLSAVYGTAIDVFRIGNQIRIAPKR